MFEKLIHELLRGEFICEYRFQALFEFLQNSEQRSDVEAWVERIGYRLSRLGEFGAFYLSYAHVDSEHRTAIRQQFKEIKFTHGPRLQFLSLVQQAQQDDFLLSPGGLIDLSQLSERVGSNPKLMDDYHAMAPSLKGSSVTASLHDNLKRILDGMANDGYVALRNPEREIYMVTGKIAYLHEVCAFLLDHEPTVEREEANPQAHLASNAAGSTHEV